MKKTYFFSLVSMIFSFSLFSQVNLNQPNKVLVPKIEPNSSVNKSTSCIDIIQYPQSKASNILLDTMDYITYIGAIGQTYYFTGNGLVHGINIYMTLDLDGIPGNKDSVSMVISVRNINGGNVPTTVLGSDTVFLYDVGFTTQDLMFSSPIAVTDSFAVVVEIDTLNPSNPYYATNDYGDGATEQLSSLAYTGIWYNLYPTWGGTWDVDMMLAPIFEEQISADYSVDTNSVCFGNSITFTNNSSVNYNTMFNTAKTSNNLYLDEFMAVVSFDSNYTHFYSSVGVFNTDFEIIQYGYTANCVIDSIMPVTVSDTGTANYTYTPSGGGSFLFADLSFILTGSIITWLWDFGDGSFDNVQNPMHTYAIPGNYTVCLTITSDVGCTSTFCDSVSFVVGQKEITLSNEVKIYPIPAKKFFTVELPTNFVNTEIVVTDIVGKKVKSITAIQHNKVKVLTDELNSGVYFVSVSSNGQKVFTQRILVDK